MTQLEDDAPDHQSWHTRPNASKCIHGEWTSHLLPAYERDASLRNLKEDDLQRNLLSAGSMARSLFDALHQDSYSDYTDRKFPFFWRHEQFDPLGDPMKGNYAIGKSELLDCVTAYLANPRMQINRFDWIFLDSIVFLELESFGTEIFENRFGRGINWAAIFARHDVIRYRLLTAVFWILGVLLWQIAPLVAAYFLIQADHENWGMGLAAIWGIFLLWSLIAWPWRIRYRRRTQKQFRHLIEIYRMLGETTISPRKLKEELDAASRDGVVLDGSVFTIVDRLISRDPTGFIPTA